tara:strand:- start:891 stop:1805 length:915 start_codon:yes stop_codon:yes gene_type:complete
MQPRVSIVVRTKDRPYFLARALTDIAAQSFDEAEVIVVNDGGDRASVDEVIGAAAISDRVRVVDSPSRTGRCVAANVGLRAAVAPFVVLHDDDDLWHPEFLTRTVANLDASTDDAGVMVATEIIYEERRGNGWHETSRAPFWGGMDGVTFTSLLEVNRAVPISFLYRRAVHDEVGYYDESLDAVEDWEFYLRLTAVHPVAFLGGTPLAYWTQRPQARGIDANSMFELSSEHERDDLVVRDRALRAWAQKNGAGLPLYLAMLDRQAEERLDRGLARVKQEILAEVYDRHPFWRRVRRLRRSSSSS